MIVGTTIAAGFILSALLFRANPSGLNFIPFIVILGSTFFYQRRVSQTIKKIIVDKTGENISVHTYGIMGTKFFTS